MKWTCKAKNAAGKFALLTIQADNETEAKKKMEAIRYHTVLLPDIRTLKLVTFKNQIS